MLVAASVTFVAVLLIVLGAYWVAIVMPEDRSKTVLRRRLRGGQTGKASLRLERNPERLSNIGVLDTALARVDRVSGPLKDTIDQSGLGLNVGTFLLLSGVCFFAAMLLVNLYLRQWWWLGLIAGVFAAFIPLVVVRMKRTSRILKFEEQFPEAIELIARAMRAGHALPIALKMAAEELAPPAGTEFKILYERQNYGADVPEALRAFAERIPSLDARFFVTAVLTQREAGGNLAEVLDRLAAVMRERFRVKREVRVRSAHGRITAFVLAGMPPTIAVMLLSINPKQMAILVSDPLGVRMIIVAVVLQVIGTLVVRKLVDIKYLRDRMPLGFVLTLVAVFGSIALLTGSIALYVLSSAAPERRRLRTETRKGRRSVIAAAEVLPLTGEVRSGWDAIESVLPKSAKEFQRMRVRFIRAGFPYRGAPVVFTLAEWLGPLILGPLPLFYLTPPYSWLAAIVTALLAFFLPGFYIEQRLAKRRQQIQNGLPDALDLLVVCIEAGSGLDQAIVKVSEELSLPYPALGEELRLVITEMRAGKPRLDAFKSLAARTKVEDVRSLVTTLVQTDKFGTSIGQALRTHADSARTKRRQRAEEAAQKIAVKLVFPLVLCFFPALYVVVLGPAVIALVRAFL